MTAGCPAWFLIPAGQPGLTVTPLPPADFSRSLGDIAADAVTVAAGQILPGLTEPGVRNLTAALASAEAAAVASWCSRTAAEYAAIRHQFGRPIGAFQAVKHLCAQMLCRAETASVLAWDAARAVADGPDALALVAAAAAAHAIDAAVANAKDCIQVLGGIGFTWEHDAHLYLRRAISLRQLLGGTSSWRIQAARLAAGGARRTLALTADHDADGELAPTRLAARRIAGSVAETARRRPAPCPGRRRLRGAGLAAAVRTRCHRGRPPGHRRRAQRGRAGPARYRHRRLGHPRHLRARQPGSAGPVRAAHAARRDHLVPAVQRARSRI